MQLVTWEQPKRTLSDGNVSEFYDRKLVDPALFWFRTSELELPVHSGALSLKLVLSGKEEYRIGNRLITLKPNEFLFINHGEHYSSRIVGNSESLSIFLPQYDQKALLQAVAGLGKDDLEGQLGNCEIRTIPQIKFRACASANVLLDRLRIALLVHDRELAMDVLRLFLLDALQNLMNLVPFDVLNFYSKRSTKDELLQRIVRAHSEILQSKGQSSNLDDLANAACLSKYYFLRLFTEIYGFSPGAYARNLRLQHAKQEIDNGTMITQAAREAGYNDVRAFQRACRRMEKS